MANQFTPGYGQKTTLEHFSSLSIQDKADYLEGLDTPSLIKFILAWVDNGFHLAQPDVMMSVAQHLDIG